MSPISLGSIRAIAFDFDGVFTDDRVLVSQTGDESVFCSRSDGLGINMLHEAEVRMIVISKETNPVVSARAKKLSLEVVQGCDNKLPALKSWLERVSLTGHQCAYMGNDINDLECMQFVGLSVAPQDAHPRVLQIAKIVTARGGGRGAIREFADLILQQISDSANE